MGQPVPEFVKLPIAIPNADLEPEALRQAASGPQTFASFIVDTAFAKRPDLTFVGSLRSGQLAVEILFAQQPKTVPTIVAFGSVNADGYRLDVTGHIYQADTRPITVTFRRRSVNAPYTPDSYSDGERELEFPTNPDDKLTDDLVSGLGRLSVLTTFLKAGLRSPDPATRLFPYVLISKPQNTHVS